MYGFAHVLEGQGKVTNITSILTDDEFLMLMFDSKAIRKAELYNMEVELRYQLASHDMNSAKVVATSVDNILTYSIVCDCGNPDHVLVLSEDYIVEIGGEEWIDNHNSHLACIIENKEHPGRTGLELSEFSVYHEYKKFESAWTTFDEKLYYYCKTTDRLLLMNRGLFFKWFVYNNLGHQPSPEDYIELCIEVNRLLHEDKLDFREFIYIVNCSRAHGDKGSRFCL